MSHATLGRNLTFLSLGSQLVTNTPARTNLEQLFSFVGSHPNLGKNRLSPVKFLRSTFKFIIRKHCPLIPRQWTLLSSQPMAACSHAVPQHSDACRCHVLSIAPQLRQRQWVALDNCGAVAHWVLARVAELFPACLLWVRPLTCTFQTLSEMDFHKSKRCDGE